MGFRFRQLVKLLQTVPSLRYLGRSTSHLFLGTRRDQPITTVRWPGMVKFNNDMGATTTALPWEICSSFSCVRCANSSLRKARTCPTSVEPSFRVWQQTQRGRTRPQSTHTTCICKRNQQVPRRVHLRGIWRAHSQTQPSFRRSTTRVPSVVVASWLSWNSSSVSRRKTAHLILETSEQIGDGSSGIDSGHRKYFIFVGKLLAGSAAVRSEGSAEVQTPKAAARVEPWNVEERQREKQKKSDQQSVLLATMTTTILRSPKSSEKR